MGGRGELRGGRTRCQHCVTATTVPSTTKEILDDPAADTISATSSGFWVLAHALREFVNREGRLPVSGAVPDMFSDSERYIQLQGIYKEKAREDMEQVENEPDTD